MISKPNFNKYLKLFIDSAHNITKIQIWKQNTIQKPFEYFAKEQWMRDFVL